MNSTHWATLISFFNSSKIFYHIHEDETLNYTSVSVFSCRHHWLSMLKSLRIIKTGELWDCARSPDCFLVLEYRKIYSVLCVLWIPFGKTSVSRRNWFRWRVHFQFGSSNFGKNIGRKRGPWRGYWRQAARTIRRPFERSKSCSKF